MNIFQRIIRDFDEEVSEVETKPCKYCEAYHNEDSEFCSEECGEYYYLETQGEDTETEGCDRYHAEKDEELSNN